MEVAALTPAEITQSVITPVDITQAAITVEAAVAAVPATPALNAPAQRVQHSIGRPAAPKAAPAT